MKRKITKILGIIFAVLTLLSLAAPLYKTTFTGGESMVVLLRGFDLYEFSAWGVVTALVPLLLIVIMFINFNYKIKAIAAMGLFVLGSMGMQLSKISMEHWIYSEANDIVYHFDGQLIYTALLLCTSVLCFIHCIMKNTDFEKATVKEFIDYLISEKISIETDSIFDKEFLLFNKPCKMIRNDKSPIVKEEKAHIIFGTYDGYFVTDIQDDSRDIEFYIDEYYLSGFAFRNADTGLIGMLYPSYDLTSYERIKVMPRAELSDGDAELYYNGKRTKINLSVKDGKVFRMTATFCNDKFDINEICGGVIIQNGKLAAIATYYDDERKLIICQDAEEQARELHKAIYEQELFEIAGGFQDFWQKNKYKKRDLIVYSEY